MLSPGLYEQVINKQMTDELQQVPQDRKAVTSLIRQRLLRRWLSTLSRLCRKAWTT